MSPLSERPDWDIEPRPFELISDFTPQADQKQAIMQLSKGVLEGHRHQVLLGVTGSGKTFTMANIIQQVQRPTLVMVHNKILAAQLYREFKGFFPNNAVEYFVSYYDYYQPEAYIPATDTYIEKDSSINDEVDRLRHSATRSLFERRDVLIVASVSCIYGLGSPETYARMMIFLEVGEEIAMEQVLDKLVEVQYERNDYDFARGVFRVKGDVLDIFPAYEENGVRVEFFGDTVERISIFDPVTFKTIEELPRIAIFPNSHYVVDRPTLLKAIDDIRSELKERLRSFEENRKYLEAQRLLQRTNYDIEMMLHIGYCNGIENYSRHLTGRKPGEPPATLLSFFPDDFLLFIDESHATLPQLHAMWRGDRSRKETLVEHGFRLPSAIDNRPLTFDEFEAAVNQTIYVSATPGNYELEKSKGRVVEQIVRPTGLIDPMVHVEPVSSQVDDLLERIRAKVKNGERVLVTTLTKRMAEDLTSYYQELGVKVRYMHSEIDVLERAKLIKGLRRGDFDVLVGINLLREGLDLPEVSLVAILDADKEGFLRSARSLIQTMGRTARNINGEVVLYADRITDSMRAAIDETMRRREKQRQYNEQHGITPESIIKNIDDILESVPEKDYYTIPKEEEFPAEIISEERLEKVLEALEKKMRAYAKQLQFEKAAKIRDEIRLLKGKDLFL